MRHFGKWFAVEEEDVRVKASPVDDSPWRAPSALGVELNLLGAKNETGRPRG